ncbi:hypothetical protein [Mesorhizobium sp.]|uniref:hypothetical protein n=1 Tax=Mesorhizobium sp. TaxID=1871066 RepID=UPI00122301C7|nr:hypothetical protein [Mesorhizobium sp.]TIN24755.1 MAG: hypothetical protein E5Y19_21550 [Mesorhizobium sp.]TJU87904.1 MAG: hypothetical protein E5Y15_05205 [Mesorhizobium sp.]TJU91869.1 MAG: hypothetical protein E5Y10_04680 [Mesorhizobium sp.]
MCIRAIKGAIINLALKIAMRRPAPDRIPMSPPRSLQNNFYEIHLVEGAPGTYVLVRDRTPEGITGLRFDEAGARTEVAVAKADFGNYQFQSIHYLKGFVLTVHSALLFVIGTITWFPRLLIWMERAAQAVFNRRNLERQDRLKVLRIFWTRRLIEKSSQLVKLLWCSSFIAVAGSTIPGDTNCSDITAC